MTLQSIAHVLDLFSLPHSWISNPITFLTNVLIPFGLIWYAIFYFLREMGILGYRDALYVILGLIISFVTTFYARVGIIGGLIAGVYIVFTMDVSLFIKIIILGSSLIFIFIILPSLIG